MICETVIYKDTYYYYYSVVSQCGVFRIFTYYYYYCYGRVYTCIFCVISVYFKKKSFLVVLSLNFEPMGHPVTGYYIPEELNADSPNATLDIPN